MIKHTGFWQSLNLSKISLNETIHQKIFPIYNPSPKNNLTTIRYLQKYQITLIYLKKLAYRPENLSIPSHPLFQIIKKFNFQKRTNIFRRNSTASIIMIAFVSNFDDSSQLGTRRGLMAVSKQSLNTDSILSVRKMALEDIEFFNSFLRDGFMA